MLVLLSASVKRFGVSRMRDFFIIVFFSFWVKLLVTIISLADCVHVIGTIMSNNMVPKRYLQSKSFLANVTSISLLSCMDPNMMLQRSLVSAGIRTIFTTKGFFSCVVTLFAHINLLACVYYHMTLPTISLYKTLVTNCTLEWFLLSMYQHIAF